MRAKINIYNGDSLAAMRKMPDNAYSLCIADPPYGIGESGGKDRRGKSRHEKKDWDKEPPPPEYFGELLRVSENQIIWGANYFTRNIPSSMGWVFWDKKKENSDFSDGELAFTSFDRALKKFEYSNTGGDIRGFGGQYIQPCSKPVALYKWLLSNYAKPGDTILDTHGGSMSIAIACWDAGYDLDLWELDADYYAAGVARFEKHKAQGQFDLLDHQE